MRWAQVGARPWTGPLDAGGRPYLREGGVWLELLGGGAFSMGGQWLCTMVVTQLPTAPLLLLPRDKQQLSFEGWALEPKSRRAGARWLWTKK